MDAVGTSSTRAVQGSAPSSQHTQNGAVAPPRHNAAVPASSAANTRQQTAQQQVAVAASSPAMPQRSADHHIDLAHVGAQFSQ